MLHVVVLHAASAAVMASSAPVSFGALVMDVKLTGQNYRDWAFSFKMLLRSVGLASHLTDEPPVAAVNDKAAQDWSLQDDRVMAAICLNTDLSIRLCLEDYNTAKAMWNYLQGRYQQSSSALRYSLRQNLHHLQQQDMEIEEYYIAFTKLSSQLASMVPKPSSLCTGCVSSWAARDKYDQENTMFDFVMGLRSEFEPIRVQLLGRPTLPTLSETLSALLAEETRLKTLTSNSPVSQHSVLGVRPLFTEVIAAASSKKTPCRHCGRTNHPDERCFKKYPHLLAEMRAKRSASRRGTTTSGTQTAAFQFPQAAAHQQSAPQFQQQSSSTISAPVSAYMSASSLSSPSHPGTNFWVLDSGASFHMTSNFSQLDSCQPISHPRSVQTADGTFCTVTHQGNLVTSQFDVSDVSLVPKLSMNLISVGKLADLNCVIGFDDTSCFIQDRRTRALLGTGHRLKSSSGLYILDHL